MNKHVTLALLSTTLVTSIAFGMQSIESKPGDWGHNGWLLQTIEADKLEFTNKPEIWNALNNEQIRQLVGLPLDTLKEENGKLNVNCAWIKDLLDEQKKIIEQEFSSVYAVPATSHEAPATPTATVVSKKRFFLTRVAPVVAAFGIGYLVGKQGYLE